MSHLTQTEPEEGHEPRHSVTDNAMVNSNISISPGRPLIQYRNGFFQGFINEFDQRQGKGVYYWSSGEIYYGDWNSDRMEGEGIFYFALGGYVYGTFLDDKVHGYAILCFSNGDYIAGFWERGFLSGKAVQYSKAPNDWCLYEYKDGISERTLMTGKGTPPIHTFSMLETYYLKKLIERDLSLFGEENPNQEKPVSKNIDFLPIDPDGWYHGNLKNRGPHGLGIVCYSEHKSDRGIFKDGAVNGPGRSLFETGDVYDGFYKEGKFHGVGVYFKSETEQYLYGMYENNECVQALTLGAGYPHELMKTLKTDFKLDNVDFIDKETESEVLTLSSQDQSMAEAIEHHPNKHLIENAHEGLFDKFLAQTGGEKKTIDVSNKLESIEEEKISEVTPKKNQDEKNSSQSKKSLGDAGSPQKEKAQYNSSKPLQPSAGSIKIEDNSQKESIKVVKTIEKIKTSQSVEVDKKAQPQGKSEGNLDSHRKSDKLSIDNYLSRGNEVNEEQIIVRKSSKNSQEQNSQSKVVSKPNLSISQKASEKSADINQEFANKINSGVQKMSSFSEEQVDNHEDKQGKPSTQYQARTSEILEKEPISQIAENISRPVLQKYLEENTFLQGSTRNPPANGRPYTEANSPEWRSLTLQTPPRSVKSEADRNNVQIKNQNSEGKINRNEHNSINNEVQKIMQQIFGSGILSKNELEEIHQHSQRNNDVNGSSGSPQKDLHNHEYAEAMSFRKGGSGSESSGNKLKSDSKTGSNPDLQAKVAVNKQIEHSAISNSTPRKEEDKSSDDAMRRGSKIESGRMITETWSLNTGGSQVGGNPTTKQTGLRGNDGLSAEYHLVREVTSEILDSSRYHQKKKESYKSKQNEYPTETLENEEEVYKVMLHKMEVLMREQSKTVETMDEMKRSINNKNFDSTKEILRKMYQELVELNRLSHISLNVVHTKLDSLLLQQGCKPADLESIRGNTQTLLFQEAQKQAILSSPQRPEIYILDSQTHQSRRSMEEKRLFEKGSPELPSAQIFRSQYANNNEPRSSVSTHENPNSAYLLSATKRSPGDSVLEQRVKRSSPDYRTSGLENKIQYDDDMANYMSVATDSAPLKQIHSMTPNSRHFGNESTFTQYDEKLRNSQEKSGQSHLTNSNDKNKSVDYIPSTPGKKPGLANYTTPQSRSQVIYQEDYAKKTQTQTKSPIQSNRSSVVIDINGSPDRFTKHEGYTSKLSHTSSHSRPAILESREQLRQSISNHVSPDKINGQRQSKYDSKHREEVEAFNGSRKWTGDIEEKKNIEKSSVGTYGSKGYENIRSSDHNSNQHHFPEERGIRERSAGTNNENTVFDNFIVTSNNNRIPTNDEYIHIDRGNVFNRNVGIVKGENLAMSGKKIINERTSWRNSVEAQDINNTAYHLSNEAGVSPLQYRREPVSSPLKARSTVHEGRLGTVKWRLELEQVEDEYDRISQRETDEEGPVKQEALSPYDYNNTSNRQAYKLNEKAKQNYVIDPKMSSVTKQSHHEQSLPKRENYNAASSSYGREDEVLDEKYRNYETPNKNWDSNMIDNSRNNSVVGHRQEHM